MAVQYTTYNTDGTTRTFPSTKHIATIQHVGVYLKRVVDNVWVVVNVNDYALVQNSIIFDTAPDSVLYAQVEVRVADDAAEITTSPSDIALVAGSIVNVDTVATNIASVNTVATNIGAVTTTSGSIANVNTVAANIVNVNLAGGNTANINAVATSITNINSVATTVVPNITEILLADDNAATATAQAGIATTQATLSTNKALESQHWANYTTDAAVPEGIGEFSAKHYATKAAASALSVAPVNQQINAATAKTTPVDADLIGLVDSADSFSLKRLSIGNLKKSINQLFFDKPHQSAPLFTKASVSTITIPIGTSVKVGANIITVSGTAYTLSLNSVAVGALDTGTKAAGTDYYVYALEAGGFILSANATNPTGYTTANSRKIGGFHYGVIPEAFTAINNIVAADATKIAGINAYTFWDLKFMPSNGDARGMFKANTGKWYDLYLLNVDHHTFGTSAAGKTIAGGTVLNGRNFPKIPLFYGGDGTTTYGTLTYFEAAEIGKAYGKEMISYEEFCAIAYGVLEATSAGAADTGVTQHLANFTSKFGVCMATGCQWIWGKDLSRGTGATYAWKVNTEGRGSIYSDEAGPAAAIFGGYRDYTVESGSRSSRWNFYVWNTTWDNGCRYACDHLELA